MRRDFASDAARPDELMRGPRIGDVTAFELVARSTRRAAFHATVVSLVVAVAFAVSGAEVSSSQILWNDVLVRAEAPAPLVRYTHDEPAVFATYLPFDEWYREELLRGHAPFWLRHHGAGVNVIGQAQYGVLHPLKLFVAVFPEHSAQTTTLLFGLIFALVGTFTLARILGMSRIAATSAATLFALSSHMASIAGTNAVPVFAHLPWLVLTGVACAVVGGGRAMLAFSAVVASCLLAGHPSYALTVFFTAGLVILSLLPRAGIARGVLSLGAGAVAGAAFSSPQLFALYYEIRDGWTYKIDSDFKGYIPFDLGGWFDALEAMLLRHPSPFANRWEGYAYLGPVAIVFTVVSLVSLIRSRRARPFIGFLLLLAICVPGPWMKAVDGWVVPGFAAVWYWHASLVFVVSLLFAGAIDGLRSVASLSRFAPAVALIAVVGVFDAVSHLGHLWMPHRGPWPTDSAALRVIQSSKPPERVLNLRGHALVPNTGPLFDIETLRYSASLLPKRYKYLVRLMDPRSDEISFPTYPFVSTPESLWLPHENIGFVVESKVKSSAFFTSVDNEDGRGTNPTPSPLVWDVAYEDPFVRVWRSIERPRGRAFFGRAPLVVASGVDDAVGRFRADPTLIVTSDVVEVSGIDVTSSPASLAALAAPLRAVDRSDGEVLAFERPSPTSLSIEVSVTGTQLLIVPELPARGWTATIDGRHAEIFPVNIASRGVLVPEGRHVIEMRYAVPGLRTGLAVAAATACLFAAAGWATRRRQRRA